MPFILSARCARRLHLASAPASRSRPSSLMWLVLASRYCRLEHALSAPGREEGEGREREGRRRGGGEREREEERDKDKDKDKDKDRDRDRDRDRGRDRETKQDILGQHALL
eukprot:3220529-Rhodomonas_salina.2